MALNPLFPEEEPLAPLAGRKPKIPDFIPEAEPQYPSVPQGKPADSSPRLRAGKPADHPRGPLDSMTLNSRMLLAVLTASD
jgi:hypothetical protein